MKIKLTHNCGLKGAQGNIGDVVECDEAVGQRILEIKGGIQVDADETVTAVPPPIETAEADDAEETAEAATPKKRGRPRKE